MWISVTTLQRFLIKKALKNKYTKVQSTVKVLQPYLMLF